ncbi:hypothetical protein BV20DRAFT_981535 [Pilatotrama ljubarskyi]|nr:hypothetical protein BV20DRAFT_981535 [Pilatotrama ljubarskyi]
MALVPPAPQLPGEALLEIFVYPGSLPPNRELDPSNPFSDCQRLELLGRQMTEAAYMDAMWQRWPHATAQQLQEMVQNSLNNFMERTAAAYQWSHRVHGYPPNFNRESLEESHRLFRVYAGAVSVKYGYPVLRQWFAELLAV